MPPCDTVQLEASHRILDLYCWLSYRFSDAFAGREAVEAQRAELAALIDRSIRAMGAPRQAWEGQRKGGACAC